jgi:replicative DNA helicase
MPLAPVAPSLPQDVEAERALVGACLVNVEALDEAESLIDPADFWDERSRAAYVAMLAVRRREGPVDRVSVAHELVTLGEIDTAPLSFLMQCEADSPTDSPFAAASWAKSIKELSQARGLIDAASKLVRDLWQSPHRTAEIESAFEERAAAIMDERNDTGLRPLAALLSDHYARVRSRVEQPHRIGGLSTGFRGLDFTIDGLVPGLVYVLGGPPGGYKTQLAGTIAKAVAGSDHAVAFFSLEMDEAELLKRLLLSEAGVSLAEIRHSGRADASDLTRLDEARLILEAFPIYINDRRDLSPPVVRRYLRRLSRVRPIGLIVVDYLQLVSGGDGEKWHERIYSVMKELAALARDYRCPVLILSQITKEAERRVTDGGSIEISDFYGGGGIEHRADTIMGIVRDATDATRLWVRVIKNKSGGERRAVPLRVHPPTGRIADVEER